MKNMVASIFSLHGARFNPVPRIVFQYQETHANRSWHVIAGGSRGYTLRFGDGLVERDSRVIADQNADSHFMIGRVLSALLLGGEGLFRSEPVGRIFLEAVDDTASVVGQSDFPTSDVPAACDEVLDWLGALTGHVLLRRAAADAHAALSNPAEAGVFVYRGFEWLVVGERRSWQDLAVDVGVTKAAMRDFKKLVNVDYGVRHASRSGQKLRADFDNYAYWVVALLDAIHASRARLDETFTVPDPEAIAAAVAAAVPMEPYE